MKLSIITINYNNAEGLKKTLDSVITQTASGFEHIIIDGGSTDDSVNIIHDYANALHNQQDEFAVKWLSESDSGIYNAMNKGIDRACGDYLLFLNSGDCLYDDNVISSFFNTNPSKDIISGNTVFSDNKMRYAIKPEKLYFDYFVEDSLLHSSTFIKSDLFNKYGKYSESFRIVSDWEFWVKALICGNATYDTIDVIVSCFDVTGISNQEAFIEKQKKERNIVLTNYLGRVYPLYDELKELRLVATEYKHLKKGKFGWLIKLILRIKSLK